MPTRRWFCSCCGTNHAKERKRNKTAIGLQAIGNFGAFRYQVSSPSSDTLLKKEPAMTVQAGSALKPMGSSVYMLVLKTSRTRRPSSWASDVTTINGKLGLITSPRIAAVAKHA